MFHKFEVIQDRASGFGTKIKCDGEEVHGVREINYHFEVNEVPTITLEVIPEICNLDVLADPLIAVDIGSLRAAIMCIRYYMKLDEEFRKAVIVSAKSVIEEARNSNRMDVITDYELASRIIDRVFTGER